MTNSVRSRMAGGVSLVAAAVIGIAASISLPSATPNHLAGPAAPPIHLAASVRPFVDDVPDRGRFTVAAAAIERLAPALPKTAPTTAAIAPPAPLNSASNVIVSGYQLIQSWVDYGVQLTNYVLQFIPYGYLLSGQLNIFYYQLIRPVSDSIVYGLIVPVVNDPLNPASYVNGLITVGQATINAVINTGIAQFNYFFGWLIPPLPPLPLAARSVPEQLDTPAPASDPTLAASTPPTHELTAAADEPPAAPTLATAPALAAPIESREVVEVVHAPPVDVERAPIDVVASDEAEPVIAEAPVGSPTTPSVTQASNTSASTTATTSDPTTPKTPTTTSPGGVRARGEARTGAQTTGGPTRLNPAKARPTTAASRTDAARGTDDGNATASSRKAGPEKSTHQKPTESPAKAADGDPKSGSE